MSPLIPFSLVFRSFPSSLIQKKTKKYISAACWVVRHGSAPIGFALRKHTHSHINTQSVDLHDKACNDYFRITVGNPTCVFPSCSAKFGRRRINKQGICVSKITNPCAASDGLLMWTLHVGPCTQTVEGCRRLSRGSSKQDSQFQLILNRSWESFALAKTCAATSLGLQLGCSRREL